MRPPTSFLNGRVTLHAGDCLAVLPTLGENSVDSVVCDPPYHLTSIVKRFANANAVKEDYALNKSKTAYMSRGFMGKAWDGGDVAFDPATWAAVLRVMKPGAHLVAFAAPKNSHRLACAIEDAGFEIRDTLMWLFGSGFPKSHDIAQQLEKAATIGRLKRPEVVRGVRRVDRGSAAGAVRTGIDVGVDEPIKGRVPLTTDTAKEWQGWGTALKPAYEPIILARKPLVGTVAENVLKHGVGAINIDGCRVEGSAGTRIEDKPRNGGVFAGNQTRPYIDRALDAGEPARPTYETHSAGRWPANVIHDGSEEVVGAFPETVGGGAGWSVGTYANSVYGTESRDSGFCKNGDSGSAARFFYTAKADSEDRIGSKHPTVKPLDLMQYLVRLVTPPRGLILDPFAGTGTTGEAAWREGFSAILIEREPEYLADIERRMGLCLAGPDERARESIKARLKGKPEDHGPLFSTPSLFDEAAA